jgi:hypothetical protein
VPARTERHGRIQVEFFDSYEEAVIRRDELKADLAKDPGNDQSVLIATSRNHDWMNDDAVYWSVRWVQPIEGLVPHG